MKSIISAWFFTSLPSPCMSSPFLIRTLMISFRTHSEKSYQISSPDL
jgi:hypothetical protein